MRLILNLNEEDQREFIPLLLAHLDWQPDRDTMFGAGGQAESVRLLTKFRVKELIPRIPSLMTKTMRGPGLFEPCIESLMAFGQDAKPILPELHAYERDLGVQLEQARSRYKVGISSKLHMLRKAISHVENS